MMMNGANCYSQDYTFLLSQLASRGYLAVVPRQLHPSPLKNEEIDMMKGVSTQCSSFAPQEPCCRLLTLPAEQGMWKLGQGKVSMACPKDLWVPCAVHDWTVHRLQW